jgi:prefoldin subunit 5
VNSKQSEPLLAMVVIDANIHACASYEKTIDSLKRKLKSLEAKLQEKKKVSEDEKIKYVRSAYLNARRPHVKSGIGQAQ